jgi:DnaD/phage-associated family protein
MPRAQKDIVEYFPHDAHASVGDTLTILQSRYKNDGYAVWFKILERLASSDGHYIDCNNDLKWKLFIAYLGVDEITTVEMLNLLVEIGNLDRILWGNKIIWCQALVDNVADVYKNRRRELPQKPVTTVEKPITTDDNNVTTVEKPITTDEENVTAVEKPITTAQSKVEKSKVEKSRVKKSRGKKRKEEETSSPSLVSHLSEFDLIFPKLTVDFNNAWGRMADSREMKQLKDLAEEIANAGGTTEEQIYDAFKEAALQNKLYISYVRAILCDWLGIEKTRSP